MGPLDPGKPYERTTAPIAQLLWKSFNADSVAFITSCDPKTGSFVTVSSAIFIGKTMEKSIEQSWQASESRKSCKIMHKPWLFNMELWTTRERPWARPLCLWLEKRQGLPLPLPMMFCSLLPVSGIRDRLMNHKLLFLLSWHIYFAKKEQIIWDHAWVQGTNASVAFTILHPWFLGRKVYGLHSPLRAL